MITIDDDLSVVTPSEFIAQQHVKMHQLYVMTLTIICNICCRSDMMSQLVRVSPDFCDYKTDFSDRLAQYATDL